MPNRQRPTDEWIAMVERMTRVETKVEDTRKDVQDIKSTINTFINAADDKYATKAEVKEIKDEVISNKSKITDILIKLGAGSGGAVGVVWLLKEMFLK